MGESNAVVSAYTLYRHLQQYCSCPSNYLDNNSMTISSATLRGTAVSTRNINTETRCFELTIKPTYEH